jgi:hypothetical protein
LGLPKWIMQKRKMLITKKVKEEMMYSSITVPLPNYFHLLWIKQGRLG